MSTESLQTWLYELPSFRAAIETLAFDFVRRDFPSIDGRQRPDPEHDWHYLLLCGSLLAQSKHEHHQDDALRIASACLTLETTEPQHKKAAAVLLDTLSNRRAIELAVSRGYVAADALAEVPVPIARDAARRFFANSICSSNGERVQANAFQAAFWRRVSSVQWLSVTASTSAGKSYVMERWVEEMLRNRPSSQIVYVVPTRALVDEVERDLRSRLARANLSSVSVLTVPSVAASSPTAGNVYVFTQERYHLFVGRLAASFSPDLVIVDEAHKIEDGARGTLLQLLLDDVATRNPQAQVILASPSIENPEALLETKPSPASADSLTGHTVTVNQNLIWASQARGQPRRWVLNLRRNGKPIVLGDVELASSPNTIPKKLAFIAWALGRAQSGTLVYVNGPADAQKVAHLLSELNEPPSDPKTVERLEEAAQLAEAAIHPKFALASALRAGVGFHYGNMPLLVRSAIEALFKDGSLRFLACTSTLIEGVNLPCKTIIVRGPTRGRGRPMAHADFWNLAGRAGRWGYEFQGNVVCVDPKPNVWKLGVPEKKVRAKVVGSRKRLEGNLASIAQVAQGELEGNLLPTPKRLEAESFLSYLFISSNDSSQPMSPQATAIVERLNVAVRVPFAVVRKNPGISPLGMQRLLEYFENRPNGVEDCAPVSSDDDDAVQTYTAIFARIGKTLETEAFGRGRACFRRALLVTRWMKGWSLPRLVGSWLDWLEKKDGRPPSNVQAEIRNVMEDVEQIARFKAPRLLTCYADIFRYHVERSYQPEDARRLLSTVPENLGEYLEFGVSVRTQLSLLALGMTRTSAVLLAELIVEDDLSLEQCVKWIDSHDLARLEIPVLVRRDIEDSVARSRRTH